MKAVDPVAEVGPHGRLTVGALYPLKYHTNLFLFYGRDLHKRQFSDGTRLGQQLILKLPTHGHDLLKQLLDPMAVKIIGGKPGQSTDLGLFPLLIQHLFPGTDLIFRHLPADIHSPLVQIHDLTVNFINFFSQYG